MSIKSHVYLLSCIAALTIDERGVPESAFIARLATEVDIPPTEHDNVLAALQKKNSEAWASADEASSSAGNGAASQYPGYITANLSRAAVGVNKQVAAYKAAQNCPTSASVVASAG